ncbi:MAG: hypothetical protein SGJ21_07140 [Alphaproteobacteria bacterium]|nr:hypothetical protein [Alphaproteobacteria bacterium]
MRVAATVMSLALLAGSAMAQTPPAASAAAPKTEDTWIYLRFADGAMAWNLHAGRWNQAGDTIEGQRLVFYSKPQMVDGKAITWKQDFWKIVCPANTIQIKSGEELGASLQTLFTFSSPAPYAIMENTSDYFLKLIYCDNRMIEGTTDVKGVLGVMEAMSRPKAPE